MGNVERLHLLKNRFHISILSENCHFVKTIIFCYSYSFTVTAITLPLEIIQQNIIIGSMILLNLFSAGNFVRSYDIMLMSFSLSF